MPRGAREIDARCVEACGQSVFSFARLQLLR